MKAALPFTEVAATVGRNKASPKNGGATATAAKTFKEAGLTWNKPFSITYGEGEEMSLLEIPSKQCSWSARGFRGIERQKS